MENPEVLKIVDVQAKLARGGGGNLNPNARDLTEQVRGCPHRAAGELCRDGLYAEEMFFSIIALCYPRF
jgi:hypothetical protein